MAQDKLAQDKLAQDKLAQDKLAQDKLGRHRLGRQRDWIWRGWQVRYTYLPVLEDLSALASASAPSSQQSIASRTAELAQQTAPEKPPILFLHGFGSALNQWAENLLPLSQTHRVYAIDFIGFGGSEKAIAPYKTGLWVEQVYEFWRSFIGQPIVLVGHSLGALVALTAAVKHPEMVQNLVLLTLPAARQELLPNWLQSIVGEIESIFASPLLIHPLFHVIRRPQVIRTVLRSIYVNKDRVTDAVVAGFVQPTGDRGAARTLVQLTKARTQNDFSQSTTELLPQVQAPILMLWGTEDRVIPLPWDRQFLSLHPDLKLVEIPNAGHCLYDEAAEQVNTAILIWLQEQTQQ